MKIHHIAIICSDYEISKNFYTEILGFKILREIYREERQSWKLDLGIEENYILELFSFPNPPKRASHPEACGLRHLALGVENISKKRKELIEKGIECETNRTDAATGKLFFFIKDPDDLPLEFYEL